MGDVLKCQTFHLVGQSFDEVATGQWVGSVNNATFITNDLLGTKSDASSTFGRQAERFIKTIGVQALGSTHNRGH